MSIAEELGVDADIVVYRKDPPDAATLREIIAKLESFNPGGSVKDRVALSMIEDAERVQKEAKERFIAGYSAIEETRVAEGTERMVSALSLASTTTSPWVGVALRPDHAAK